MIEGESPDPWHAHIADVLGNRVGNKFARAGLCTLGDVKRAIEYYRFYYHESAGGYFPDRDPQWVRMAGAKTWKAVLDKLEELGFDWRKHQHHWRPVPDAPPTLEQEHKEIKESIKTLIDLLEKYLAHLEGKADD